MKKLILSILLGVSSFCSMSSLHAYNNQWSDNEDYVVPNETNVDPGEGKDNQEVKGGGNCPVRDSSPVYAKTGHFTWSDSDITLPGKPGITFSRSYTSKEPLSGMFGNGWISSFESGFIKTIKHADKNGALETHYVYRHQDGLRYTFKEVNGTIETPNGMYNKIESLSDSSFKVTYPNGDVEIYENDVIVSSEDSNGNKLEYVYNQDTLLQEIKDGSGNSLKLTFGANGYVSALTDQNNRTWRYDYDTDGNLISVTNPLDGSRQYEYEKYQPDNDAQVYYHLTKLTDETDVVLVEVNYESGHTDRNAFKNGRVNSYTEGENTFTYDWNNLVSGNYLSKTDLLNNRFQFELNDSGHIIKYTDPLSKAFSYNIDENNVLAGVTDQYGNSWQHSVDDLGRIVSDTTPEGSEITYKYDGVRQEPSEITTHLGNKSTMAYDSKDNLTSLTLADESTFQASYDSKGNVLTTTDAAGVKTSTVTYNENSQPVSFTNASGETLTLSYTSYGQTGTVTNAEGDTTTYEYDILGRLTKTINTLEHEVVYQYDAAGKLLSLKDPAGNATSYEYDQYGRVSKFTHSSGKSFSYSYDKLNRVTSVKDNFDQETNYSYDKAGNITKKTIGSSSIDYYYDAAGKIIRAYDSDSRQNVYLSYDKDGQVSQERQHDKAIDYTYDLDGNLISLTSLDTIIDYSRNKLGNLTSLTDGTDTFSFSYDSNGLRKSVSYPNNLQTSFTLNEASRLIGLNNGIEQISYSYDKTGLVTQTVVDGNTTDFTYDDIGRLTSAGTDSYSYDVAGNNLNNSAKFNTSSNQLSENNTHSFEYDDYGNLSKKTEKANGNYKIFSWTVWNQLSKVEYFDNENNSLKKIEFFYGPLGRRLSKTVDGETTKYLYSGKNLIAILDNSSRLLFRVIHDEFTDSPLSIVDNTAAKRYYFHKDHLGSIVGLTDSDGNIVEDYSYDAYGNTVKTATVETGNPFAFTAREMDDSDLYYYRARYYDPTTGRFLSEDPVGIESGDFNLYRYALNNPLNFIDPSGNFIIEVVIIATGTAILYVKTKLGIVAALTVSTAVVGGISALKAYFSTGKAVGDAATTVKEIVRLNKLAEQAYDCGDIDKYLDLKEKARQLALKKSKGVAAGSSPGASF